MLRGADVPLALIIILPGDERDGTAFDLIFNGGECRRIGKSKKAKN